MLLCLLARGDVSSSALMAPRLGRSLHISHCAPWMAPPDVVSSCYLRDTDTHLLIQRPWQIEGYSSKVTHEMPKQRSFNVHLPRHKDRKIISRKALLGFQKLPASRREWKNPLTHASMPDLRQQMGPLKCCSSTSFNKLSTSENGKHSSSYTETYGMERCFLFINAFQSSFLLRRAIIVVGGKGINSCFSQPTLKSPPAGAKHNNVLTQVFNKLCCNTIRNANIESQADSN